MNGITWSIFQVSFIGVYQDIQIICQRIDLQMSQYLSSFPMIKNEKKIFVAIQINILLKSALSLHLKIDLLS
jgi:hypothetical protein